MILIIFPYIIKNKKKKILKKENNNGDIKPNKVNQPKNIGQPK